METKAHKPANRTRTHPMTFTVKRGVPHGTQYDNCERHTCTSTGLKSTTRQTIVSVKDTTALCGRRSRRKIVRDGTVEVVQAEETQRHHQQRHLWKWEWSSSSGNGSRTTRKCWLEPLNRCRRQRVRVINPVRAHAVELVNGKTLSLRSRPDPVPIARLQQLKLDHGTT